MIGALRRRLARTPTRALVVAGVASGLFVSTRLGNFIPDALAASISMFCAGFLVGMTTGLTWRHPKGSRP